MNLEEYKQHVEATRKASLQNALATLSQANAMMSEMFNLEESETK